MSHILMEIPVQITAIEDEEHFPVLLRFTLIDYHGRRHEFIEKAPVILDEAVPETFPHWIYVPAQLVSRSDDFVTIRTDKPWGVKSIDGQSVFDIAIDELPTIE